jgi:hypothetical protein
MCRKFVRLEIQYAVPLVVVTSCTVAAASKIVVQPYLDLNIILGPRIIFLLEGELNTVQQIEIRL